MDSHYNRKWDFARDKVEKDIRLFAKWEKVYWVCFAAEGVDSLYRSYKPGERISIPQKPYRRKYKFIGWYKEETFDTEWDFAKDVMYFDFASMAGQVANKLGEGWRPLCMGFEYGRISQRLLDALFEEDEKEEKEENEEADTRNENV